MMSYSQLLPLSALDLLAVSTLQAYLPSDSQTEAFFSVVILLSIDSIIVFLLLSIKANIEMKHEYLMIQATLSKESEYYDQMRNYSKVIDAKCHDLKKFISAKEIVKEKEGITKEMIKEIEETVASYSNMPLPGNKALDIVLSEKGVIWERNHITFTYDVDGKQFSFLSNSDIVSIFNNLLYNAIEYASQLQDENKRIISLTAAKKNEFLAVHVENYFDGPIKLVEGLPITTKKDSEIHGYGLKSVRYVAQKYGGTMEIGTSNHVFSADVLIPLA
jgi:nitrogen fixation/metabolism regulation signal transduction histidine kinase